MKILDLFGGAGGTACGLLSEGHDVYSVEWDADANAVAVSAGHRSTCADVNDYAAWVPGLLAWLAGDALGVWASPPCQAFSTAGKRLGAMDDRNGWPWLFAAIDHLRSVGVRVEWLLAENVPGMTHHDGQHCGDPMRCAGCYLAGVVVPAVRERFRFHDSAIIDAVDFGVPQHRRRLILWGGPRAIRWPRPTHHPIGSLFRPWWVSVREALGHPVVGGGTRGRGLAEWRPRLCDDEPAPAVTGFGSTGAIYYPSGPNFGTSQADIDAPSMTLRSGGSGHSPPVPYIRTEQTGARATTTDGPAPTVQGSGVLYGYDEDPGVRLKSRNFGGNGFQDVDMSGPSPTLLAGGRNKDNGMRVTVGGAERGRRLSPGECAALQAFPPDYPALTYKQAGNAVPPPLSAALVRAVMDGR